jgi:hypothetical protein
VGGQTRALIKSAEAGLNRRQRVRVAAGGDLPHFRRHGSLGGGQDGKEILLIHVKKVAMSSHESNPILEKSHHNRCYHEEAS